MNIEIENAIKAIKANYPDSRYTELRKGLDLAIAALEKQIPKKINVHAIYEEDEEEYMCECGMKYWRKGGVKYCIDCGQKLNWSEVENE